MLFRASVFSSLAFGLFISSQALSTVFGQSTSPIFPTPQTASRPRPAPTLDPFVLQPIAEPPVNAPAVAREQRAQSYAKLLEGQRYLWKLQASGSKIATGTTPRLAKQALARAIEINPNLAEGYTALAELIGIAGGSAAEIERLARFALRYDPNNFGAHRLLARIYTRQSDLGGESLDRAVAAKAIEEFRQIVKIDSRNAEAWAFLSEFYKLLGETDKQLEALEQWRSAAQPQEDRLFRAVTGRSAAPETAAVELGRALLKAGKTAAAIRVLSQAIADNPDENAFSALTEALETANPNEAATAVTVLQQTAFANPANPALLELLIDTQIRSGRTDDAISTLRAVIERLADSEQNLQAGLLAKLGDVYLNAGRETDAIAAYESALKAVSISNQPLAADAEREFANRVLPRLVTIYRNSGQNAKARETILRLSVLLGATDSTADQQLVELSRANGDFNQALQTVRDARKRFPNDANLLRLEAEVLTDANRVDEAATLLRSKIVNKTKQIAVPTQVRDDFLAHIAVANVYLRAGRSADAAAAANQALDLAQTDQMTNIALLSLATAQNSANNFKAAESTLRQVLKQDANNSTALNNLGYFLVERGERLPEAVELIKRAVEREPSNSSFLDSLGWAHFKLGQLAEAEKYLTQAVRYNPNSAAIQNHLGDLYERQGNSNAAKTAWRKALSLTKEAAEVQRLRNKIGDDKTKNN